MSNLEAHLVLEVFGVGEGGVVEDEAVGEGGADEVEDKAEKPGSPNQINKMHQSVHLRCLSYHVIRYKVHSCLQGLSRAHSLMYAYREGSS